MSHHPLKTSLQIRLMEPVVYLKDVDFSGHRRTHNETSTPSVLRGLLVLDLAKPTRISSVEIQLQAKSSTAWPEGTGPRRVEVGEENELFSATTLFFRASSTPTSYRRAISVDPGLRHYRDEEHEDEYTGTDSGDDLSVRQGRHISADHPIFQPNFVNHQQTSNPPTPPEPVYPAIGLAHSTSNIWTVVPPLPLPSPAHLPRTPPPTSTGSRLSTLPTGDESPSQALEDFRRALRSELSTISRRRSFSSDSRSSRFQLPTPPSSSSSSTRSQHIELNGINVDERSRPLESPVMPPTRHDSDEDARGRRKSKFNLSLVPATLFDYVWSNSLLATQSGEGSSRERQDSRRERLGEKGKTKGSRFPFVKVSEVLGLDSEVGKEDGAGWKEFKKGTYTYPISFSIPADSPSSLQLDHGSVVWRLNATVHRPGTFTTKLTTTREVTVVASPSEDDIEETESIVVERTWDNQMQYLLVVSGRSFALGGSIPVQITFMPFTKIKIHRISILLEEVVSYHAQMKQVVKTDMPKRVVLVSIKYPDKANRPILPLMGDDVDTFKTSPLYHLLVNDDQNGAEDHPRSDFSQLTSDIASNLMGPGPWTLQFDANIPKCCFGLHPTNSNQKSNITVRHTLNIVLRVERGDDEQLHANGKRKTFDIVIHTPIHLLSCLCNPDFTSLPTYSESWVDLSTETVKCRCHNNAQGPVHQSSPNVARSYLHPADERDSPTEEAETDAVISASQSLRRPHGNSALGMNTQYERLMTGQESEMGEAPPSYHIAIQSRV